MFKKNHIKLCTQFVVVLFLCLAPQIVLACSYVRDPHNPNFDPAAENALYGQYFFIATWALLLLNVGFAFFSLKKYLRGIISMFLATVVQWIFVSITMIFGDSCHDFSRRLLVIEAVVLLAGFVFQVAVFIYRRQVTLK